MSVIVILILASLAVALAFLAGFIWAVKTGQFEDTCTPAMRILSEDEARPAGAAGGAVNQAGLHPAPMSGVRLSSGAAASDLCSAPGSFGASVVRDVAAPEDGRTPAVVVALSGGRGVKALAVPTD